jgi:hypothetical protein
MQVSIVHYNIYNRMMSFLFHRITFENSKDVIERCRICKRSYRSVCLHYHDQNVINILLRKQHKEDFRKGFH